MVHFIHMNKIEDKLFLRRIQGHKHQYATINIASELVRKLKLSSSDLLAERMYDENSIILTKCDVKPVSSDGVVH
jgi:hypothetical protein